MADADDIDPMTAYRIGQALKLAAVVFLETVPPDVDPILYGPGFELRLTRLDPEPADPNQLHLFDNTASHATH